MALPAQPLLARQYYGGYYQYYCMVASVVSGFHLSKIFIGLRLERTQAKRQAARSISICEIKNGYNAAVA